MAVPDEKIDEVKAAVNIIDLIDGFVPLKKSGANYIACCPFHSEKTPSFTVTDNKDKVFYHCFGCGAHGDQIDFMIEYMGVTWNEAVIRLANMGSVTLPEADENSEDSVRIKAKATVAGTLAKAAAWMHEHLGKSDAATKYINVKRKVDSVTSSRFLIGYAPKVLQDYISYFSDDEMKVLESAGVIGRDEKTSRLYPKFGGRIVFPIRDVAGAVIGFGARVMDESLPKYINSPDSDFFNKGRELFRSPDLRTNGRRAGHIIVTEGYFDVVATEAQGFGNTCAAMGTAMTKSNVESLFAIADNAIFCFDGDTAGKTAAWRSLESCLPYIGKPPAAHGRKEARESKVALFVFLPAGEDPDSFIASKGKEAFQLLINNAQPLSTFFLEAYSAKREKEPLEKHLAMLDQASKMVAQVNDDVLRNGLVDGLAKVFGASAADVRKRGGIKGTQKVTSPTVIPIRADALEESLLGTLIKRPWEVSMLATDIDLQIAGGNEIVSEIRKANIKENDDDIPSKVSRIFSGTPYQAMIDRLNSAIEGDIEGMSKRVEFAWVSRELSEMASIPFGLLKDAERERVLILSKRKALLAAT